MTRALGFSLSLLLLLASNARAESADLSVAFAPQPRTFSGREMWSSLSVKNEGPDVAKAVKLQWHLPVLAGMLTTAKCTLGLDDLRCELGDLAPGEEREIRANFDVPKATSFPMDANVASSTPDPRGDNNSTAIEVPLLQGAEPRLTLEAQTPIGTGHHETWYVDLENHGAEVAADAIVEWEIPASTQFWYPLDERCTRESATLVRCSMGSLNPDVLETKRLYLFAAIEEPGTYTTKATLTTSTPDVDPSNNSASASVEVIAVADLDLEITGIPTSIPEDRNITFTVEITNKRATDALNVGFWFGSSKPSDLEIVSAEGEGWTCPGFGGSATCNRAVLPANGKSTITIHARPGQRAERVPLVSSVGWGQIGFPGGMSDIDHESFVVYLPFHVTNANDSGAGSLRQAILDLNSDAACAKGPCAIDFNLAPLDATIEPLTPLPDIERPDVLIDGTTQSQRVELNGHRLAAGNGLTIRGSAAVVRGLAINFFPGDGIHFHSSPNGAIASVFEDNFIGTDVTGLYPRPNFLRGLSIEGDTSGIIIQNNVLSGNFRSGLFVWSGRNITVKNNKIGVGVDGQTPLGNGRSGIFFGPTTSDSFITDNVIAHHPDFGVAIAEQAPWITAERNTIYDSGVAGVDIGLDGPQLGSAYALAPEILDAIYDPAENVTHIRVQMPFSGYVSYRCFFYANDKPGNQGYGEGHTFLGEMTVGGEATFTYNGDLRGQFVAATATGHWNLDGTLKARSSQFGRAVAVR